MTIEERIAKADKIINWYWGMMNSAIMSNSNELYDYWLAKWAAAKEIFEVLTGGKWYPIK